MALQPRSHRPATDPENFPGEILIAVANPAEEPAHIAAERVTRDQRLSRPSDELLRKKRQLCHH